MAEETLRNAGFKGRIIRVHASKGKYARAEPISALYEQGRVANHGNLYVLEKPADGIHTSHCKEIT